VVPLLLSTNAVFERTMSIEKLINSSCSVAYLIVSESNETRPELRKDEIRDIGANLATREAERALMEDQINRIRDVLYSKTSRGSEAAVVDLSFSSDDGIAQTQNQTQPSTNRDILRRKLREKESNLVRKTSCVMEEMNMRRCQVKKLVAEISEKDYVCKKLETELEHFNMKAMKDVDQQRIASFDQLEHMERKIEANGEEIDHYEFKVRAGAFNVQNLKAELAEKERRVVELEVELETHEIKFMSHQKHADWIDEQTIDEMLKKDTGKLGSGSLDQQYIRKLHSDLEEMEKRYVTEKILSAVRMASLEKENKVFESSTISLKRRLKAYRNYEVGDDLFDSRKHIHLEVYRNRVLGNDLNDEIVTDISPSSSDSEGPVSFFRRCFDYLKERLGILELENIEYCQKIKELKATEGQAREKSQARRKRLENELSSLYLENEALILKNTALETDMSLASNQIHVSEWKQRYSRLESKIDEKTTDILSLEELLNIKDRIIAKLRSQTVDVRLGAVVSASRSLYTPYIWTDDDDQLSLGTSDETEASCILELKSQLQDSQRQLAKLRSQTVDVRLGISPSRSLHKPNIWTDDDQLSLGTADETEGSYILELQSQLQDSQRQLTEREEELCQVRSKSSARVAELQARLAAMTTKQKHLSQSESYFV
jgi:hypothetical protein